MSTLTYSHAGAGNPLVHPGDDNHVWRAVIVSVVIHLLVVVIYPHLNKVQLPDIPERMEIEFFTMKMPSSKPGEQQVSPAVMASVPPAPQKTVTTVKPRTATSAENPQSVITAPTTNEANYPVPEQALPAREPLQVAHAATSSANSEASPHAVNEGAKEPGAVSSLSAQVSSETDELSATDSDAWGDYGEQLRSLVNKSKQYPTIAVRRHLEGEVTILAQFVRGELVQVSLTETSKHLPLDEEALRMVKKAIQQLGLKDSLKRKTFKITIPVSFKLE